MGNTLCPPAPDLGESDEMEEMESVDLMKEFQPGLYRALAEKLIVREGVNAATTRVLKELPQDALLDIVNVVLFTPGNASQERLRGELREGGWISMYYPEGDYFFVVSEDVHPSLEKEETDAVSLDFDRKDSEEYDDEPQNLVESDLDEESQSDDDYVPSSPQAHTIEAKDLNSISAAPESPATQI